MQYEAKVREEDKSILQKDHEKGMKKGEGEEKKAEEHKTAEPKAEEHKETKKSH